MVVGNKVSLHPVIRVFNSYCTDLDRKNGLYVVLISLDLADPHFFMIQLINLEDFKQLASCAMTAAKIAGCAFFSSRLFLGSTLRNIGFPLGGQSV